MSNQIRLIPIYSNYNLNYAQPQQMSVTVYFLNTADIVVNTHNKKTNKLSIPLIAGNNRSLSIIIRGQTP